MKIEEIMSRDVVTVGADTTLKAVAQLLVDNGISGMPVVDEAGAVIGVISEADLLVKERGGSPPTRRRGPSRLLGASGEPDAAKRRAHVARDAMTSPAVTIAPYRSVAAAAREMLDRGINRLPVIRNGSLVGIVSRADLMRAFARSDEEVAADVRDRVEHFLALENDHHTIDVGIDVGEVTVTGRVDRRLTAEALPDVIASIPGVVEVHSELTWVEEASAR